MARLTALALASLAVGCAALPVRERRGDITLRSTTSPTTPATSIGVQAGRIVSGSLDFALDPDLCVRGLVSNQMIVLCPKDAVAKALAAAEPGARVEKWVGTGGDLTLEVSKDHKTVTANGYLRAGGTKQVLVTLPFAEGPQWDELRAHPVLYVVAATMAGISGEGSVEVE